MAAKTQNRKTAPKALQQKKISAQVRDPEDSMPKVAAAIVLYGLAVLVGYIVLAAPQTDTVLVSIQNCIRGAGGKLAVLFPLIIGWAAVLVTLSAAGKEVRPRVVAADAVLILMIFTAAQLIASDAVRAQMIYARADYSNFLYYSYRTQFGGGLIGALLAWPLCKLSKWGGLIVVLIVCALSLMVSGHLSGVARRLGEETKVVNQNVKAYRAQRESDKMFDVRPTPPRRNMDPYSDRIQPHTRKEPRPVGVSRFRDESDELPWSDDSPNPAVFKSREAAPNKTNEVRKKRAAVQECAPEASRFDIPEERLVAPAEETRKAQPIDIEPFEPEPIKHEAAHEPAEIKAPAETVKKRPAKVIEEGVAAVPVPREKIQVKDDLTIEPDSCDVLETGDAPADKAVADEKPKPSSPKGLEGIEMKVTQEGDEEPYNYPPIDLLHLGENVHRNHREADLEKAELLAETLSQFGISTTLTGIAHGPAVTRFELQPAPGVKVSRITALSDDIAMHLAAMSVRIEAPIPGKAAVGVEIPNDKIEMVRLRDVLESQEARKSPSRIAVGLGKDNSGRFIVADIAKMPHVLIAGQTGSGKSVCINSIITSILFRATPKEVRLILIDPKMVELSVYNDIPHLVCPVVTDCKKASAALQWAVGEMTGRYKKFAERGVRDIKGYNKALEPGEEPMPQMVIIIDELADLMMVAPGEVEDSICRLAQLARACGMHLVIATQRPSVNVITGIIKANIPTRIAFSVASQVDSRTMIDHGGAEKLLGNGDMLFVPNGINKPMRVQGAWVSDEEVHAIVQYIKERTENVEYDQDMIERMDNCVRSDAEKEEVENEYDPRLPEAVEIVVEAGQASTSMLQRRMRVGYARAGRLIDEMEKRGIVSVAEGAKPRNVLLTREQFNEMFAEND